MAKHAADRTIPTCVPAFSDAVSHNLSIPGDTSPAISLSQDKSTEPITKHGQKKKTAIPFLIGVESHDVTTHFVLVGATYTAAMSMK